MISNCDREFPFADLRLRLSISTIVTVCISVAVMLYLPSCTGERMQQIPEYLPGKYEGHLSVTVRSKIGFAKYVFRKSPAPVKCAVEVSNDGMINGKLGNALFKDASIRPNRNAFERWLNMGTDYKITGKLISPVFDGDTVRERSVSIPFVNHGDSLSGSIFEGSGFEIYPLTGFELKRVLP
jgi:hypothetical protein